MNKTPNNLLQQTAHAIVGFTDCDGFSRVRPLLSVVVRTRIRGAAASIRQEGYPMSLTKQEKEAKFRQFWESMANDPRIQAHFSVGRGGQQFCNFEWGQANARFGVMFYQKEHRLFTNLNINFKTPRIAKTDPPAIIAQKKQKRKASGRRKHTKDWSIQKPDKLGE